VPICDDIPVYYLLQPLYHHLLQEVLSSRDGHKTIGKKLGKMFSKFRTRGKSLTLDSSPGPTATAKLANLPLSPSTDLSDDEYPDEEVRYLLYADHVGTRIFMVACIHPYTF